MTSDSSATAQVRRSLPKRYARERRFRFLGLAAIVLTLLFLVLLLGSIFLKGWTAFQQTHVRLDVYFDPAKLDVGNLNNADYGALVRASLQDMFPEAESRSERLQLNRLVSTGAAFILQDILTASPELIGSTQPFWLPADDEVDMLIKGHSPRDVPESARRLSDRQLGWIDSLLAQERLEKQFNTAFFKNGDSREPELAGVRGAITGSFYTLMLTLALSFPIGVAAAIYLEEFAPKNRFTDLIEVNINNLAAIPSIIFGLLGLAVFLNFFGLPRSSSVVGGLVLTLMTLPTIIIASRASLKAVPPSIHEAALAVGASKVQTIFHHVLPLALPGMLTGTIIGMAQALGETAPLLMIGMVAFIVDVPQSLQDPATVLPVQIYLWADSPERGFIERTSAAIMILLLVLLVMNAAAVYLRNRFERRW
ncbi:MAG: phosphate ABC transporter permease PstA [bacterium]|nr:phosphate ABC transporter permease PstA [bacterium]